MKIKIICSFGPLGILLEEYNELSNEFIFKFCVNENIFKNICMLIVYMKPSSAPEINCKYKSRIHFNYLRFGTRCIRFC